MPTIIGLDGLDSHEAPTSCVGVQVCSTEIKATA